MRSAGLAPNAFSAAAAEGLSGAEMTCPDCEHQHPCLLVRWTRWMFNLQPAMCLRTGGVERGAAFLPLLMFFGWLWRIVNQGYTCLINAWAEQGNVQQAQAVLKD